MKKFMLSLFCMALILNTTGCGKPVSDETVNTQVTMPVVSEIAVQTEEITGSDLMEEGTDIIHSDSESTENMSEEDIKPDETVNTQVTMPVVSEIAAQTEETTGSDLMEEDTEINNSGLESNENTNEEESMKLFIDNVEIPVIWENNNSVAEMMEEASKGDIVISMSMYGGNEQVGSLGKRYKSNDRQTTTHNGDVVLYNSSNLVVFYGSNSWAYTRLGKMDLSEKEVTDLLSNGDVTITIKR